MAKNFNRLAVKRENEQVALEQLASEEELQQAINELLDEEERRDREWNEYTWRDFEEDMNALERSHDRGVYRQHEMSHRGQLVDPEESHYALVDPAERDLLERREYGEDFKAREHNESIPDPRDLDRDWW